MDFVILPIHIYQLKYFPKKYNYHIWEHPQWFKKYNFNKKKLILHRASMRYLYSQMKSKKYKVEYYTFKDKPKLNNWTLYDPIDKIDIPKSSTILESPNFLLDKDMMEEYRDKTDKFFFHYFYNWSKKKLKIIPNVKSKDKDNRKTMPKSIKIPKIPSNSKDSRWIKEAQKYIDKHFKKNYGTTDNFKYPVTHTTAKLWLRKFIQDRFKNFGSYQDYMRQGESFMFHSVLSTSINIGLLHPKDIVKEIGKVKSKIPINSYEGYIRQLFWREYQRYCYIYCNFNSNYFGNRKKLTKMWYDGKTGIEPVDDCIKKAFSTGYLHHIERLMVVGNYMNLYGISPKEGFKWFMEFSCDSYEWVMYQNVYDMVFFVTGGETMRRPYASSSNYVLKMSNYKKGDWSDKWDKLYKNFIKKNKKKLHKFRYYFRL